MKRTQETCGVRCQFSVGTFQNHASAFACSHRLHSLCVPFFPRAIMFIKTEYIPMTRSARDSLVAIAVLWVVFAITVVFRFVGRIRGIGLGLDDILSAVALVSFPEPGSR